MGVKEKNMKEKLIEISEVVRKLNLEIFDCLDDNVIIDYLHDPPFMIITDCVEMFKIKFFGSEVWDYYSDERKIIAQDDESNYIYEDLEDFLRDQIKKRANVMTLCTI